MTTVPPLVEAPPAPPSLVAPSPPVLPSLPPPAPTAKGSLKRARTVSSAETITGLLQERPQKAPAVAATAAAKPPAKPRAPRGKLVLKYIEDRVKRLVSQAKRKNGLILKAGQLEVLTGCQVHLLIAAPSGYLYTYSSDSFEPLLDKDGPFYHQVKTCLDAARAKARSTDPSKKSFDGSNASHSEAGAGSEAADLDDEDEDKEEEEDDDDVSDRMVSLSENEKE